MLRLAYINFMQELQKALKEDVGLPFNIKIDVNIAIPKDEEKHKKLIKFTEDKLKPVLNSISSYVGHEQ